MNFPALRLHDLVPLSLLAILHNNLLSSPAFSLVKHLN